VEQALEEGKVELVVYKVPQTIEAWSTFSFPDALLTKANTLMDDFNLMTRFIFDKGESTFYFANKAVDLLLKAGMSLHSLPILFFLHFLAKDVMRN